MIVVLYILAGLVLLIAILAIIAPKSYDVNRDIIINKNKADVFAYLKSLKNQDNWSPWAAKDPNMKKDFKGTDGEVGCVSYWEGNKDVGKGEQEITKIVDGERIEGELRFLKPFKSTSNCYLTVTSIDDNKTKVTWGFSGSNKFPVSIMMLFMNMDKSVGGDFESGLNKLKSILD